MNDTATAEARRPSPRPRTAGAPSRPVDDRRTLRVVPEPDDDFGYIDPAESEPCTVHSEVSDTPTPGNTFPQVNVNTDGAHAGPARFTLQGAWASTKAAAGRTGAYWTPPALLTDQPASLAELAQYARHAPWTAHNRGAVRKAGVVYWSGLALPYTTVSRYREWVVQRPGRLAAHLGAIKLLAMTTPGIWVVDHLVYPVAQFAGHLFL